jgi:hypothetical protein
MPDRILIRSPGPSGEGTTFHDDPSQRSIMVMVLTLAVRPTAQQSDADRQVTPSKR